MNNSSRSGYHLFTALKQILGSHKFKNDSRNGNTCDTKSRKTGGDIGRE